MESEEGSGKPWVGPDWFLCLVVHSCPSLLQPFWIEAHQASLSMGFPRQEWWRELPFPPPRDLPDPGIKPLSPMSPALQADSLPPEPSHWEGDASSDAVPRGEGRLAW